MYWPLSKWNKFIEICRSSKSKREVAKRMKIPLNSVSYAINHLVDNGEDMPDLPTGSILDSRQTTEFIQTWTECDNIIEFCEKTGLERHMASIKAYEIRRAGVKLKTFAPERVDWDRLRALADELHPDRRKNHESKRG